MRSGASARLKLEQIRMHEISAKKVCVKKVDEDSKAERELRMVTPRS
jgi:hypothetical protein